MEETRKNIIQKSTELFVQYGLRSISIDDICSELRISKKTFYNIFPQKEDLIIAVLQFQHTTVIKKFQALTVNKNAVESLIIIVKEVRKNINNVSQALYYDLEKYYPQLLERLEDKKQELIQKGFEANLIQGKKEGLYRDDLNEELVSLFYSMQIRSIFSTLSERKWKKYTKKQLLDFFIDVIFRLIVTEEGKQYLKEHFSFS
jgi:AcrR family transcriptional regulator